MKTYFYTDQKIRKVLYDKFFEDLGYSAAVSCHDERLKRLDQSAEVAKYVNFLEKCALYVSTCNFAALTIENVCLIFLRSRFVIMP